MPYIKRNDRQRSLHAPMTEGELNYAISTLIDVYVGFKGLSYATISDVLSACEGAKQEFYSRVARPYEDLKIVENGEVFHLALAELAAKQVKSHTP